MGRTGWLVWIAIVGCSPPEEPDGVTPFAFAEPDDRPADRGPGGPSVTFDETELFENCAVLDVGEIDSFKHRNLVMPYRGHLVMPWAPEWGRGGLAFFEMSDPCNPVLVGDGFYDKMRETHAIGFLHVRDGDQAGDYAVVNDVFGIQIWDVTDPSEPYMRSRLELEGVYYPDSYSRVSLSVFWQHPWLYVAAADNGIFVVNTEDIDNPVSASHYVFDPPLRAGGVFALGNQLLVTAAKESSQALMDISVPDQPQLHPQGRFDLYDGDGELTSPYHANLVGDWALFARKGGGGGPIVYDVSDPNDPHLVGDLKTGHSGGYIFYDEGYLFEGEGSAGFVYDARDPAQIEVAGEFTLAGDLDTVTPYGNVALVAVDDEAEDDEGTVVSPWNSAPDDTGPTVLRVDPPPDATLMPTTARIGVGFDEFIDSASVFAGSIRLRDESGNAVDGWGSAQETIATFVPKEPLEPNTVYSVEVMPEGIVDLNGNFVTASTIWSFTTAGAR